MHPLPPRSGCIEVICGSMFAGKTQELIRRLRLAAIARQKVQVFKHDSDARYSKDDVVSHDQIKIPSIPISTPSDLLKHPHPTTRGVGGSCLWMAVRGALGSGGAL